MEMQHVVLVEQRLKTFFRESLTNGQKQVGEPAVLQISFCFILLATFFTVDKSLFVFRL
jgi:hypothetical protein